MRTVSAREANHRLSELLTRAERGEQTVITRHGKPIAVLQPHQTKQEGAEREAAIKQMVAMMEKGLPWPKGFRHPTRDEMHER